MSTPTNTNAWLKAKKKTELSEIADKIGLKKYVFLCSAPVFLSASRVCLLVCLASRMVAASCRRAASHRITPIASHRAKMAPANVATAAASHPAAQPAQPATLRLALLVRRRAGCGRDAAWRAICTVILPTPAMRRFCAPARPRVLEATTTQASALHTTRRRMRRKLRTWTWTRITAIKAHR